MDDNGLTAAVLCFPSRWRLHEKLGRPLDQLSLAELHSIDKAFGRDALDVFRMPEAMAKRNMTGAPGTKEVARQLAKWRTQLSS